MKFIALIIFAFGRLAAACDPPPPPPPATETVAWCSPDPWSARATADLTTIRDAAGIDVIMGPCYPPPAGYTTAEPGTRYGNRDTYNRLVELASTLGLKVIVYDPAIWSDDPNVRNDAINYWSYSVGSIYAFDMGDEFMPNTPEWEVLRHRWDMVLTYVEPVLGLGPFTNHVGQQAALDAQLDTLTRGYIDLNFDLYLGDGGVALAAQYNPYAQTLGCAVNTIRHAANGQLLNPTPAQVTAKIRELRQAGCDRFIIFTGATPINTPGFNQPSLLNSNGTPSPMAAAVKQGAQP